MAKRVIDPTCLCGGTDLIPSLAQWAKDLALLQLWHRLQPQLRFEPWPGNFHMPCVQPEKRREGRKEGKKEGIRRQPDIAERYTSEKAIFASDENLRNEFYPQSQGLSWLQPWLDVR